MSSFFKTAETLIEGSHTLAQKYYVNDSILKKEMKNIFFNSWICCGRIQDLPKQGSYKLIEIDNESIIILKNTDNSISAFYNVCRHRGTKICKNDFGSVSYVSVKKHEVLDFLASCSTLNDQCEERLFKQGIHLPQGTGVYK